MVANLLECELKKLSLANGHEFHFVEAGVGPPLVFIHGGAGDYTTWRPQWTDFTRRFRCISYSRRYSSPNQNALVKNHSAVGEAQDLAGLIEAWAATPAILVGASYGAFTALVLAVTHPELVRAMVLIEPPLMQLADATASGRTLRDDFMRNVREPAKQAFLANEDDVAMDILSNGIGGASNNKGRDSWQSAVRRRNAPAMKALTLSADEFPAIDEDAVRGLRMPILLVRGEKTKPLMKEIFEVLCSRLPQAQRLTIVDSGHAVAREASAEFNRLALEFLERAFHAQPAIGANKPAAKTAANSQRGENE